MLGALCVIEKLYCELKAFHEVGLLKKAFKIPVMLRLKA